MAPSKATSIAKQLNNLLMPDEETKIYLFTVLFHMSASDDTIQL
jgi:hypothetical protein